MFAAARGSMEGFCCGLFFFNASITLAQTDNSSQPLHPSSNPADPLLCVLLAWAAWHFLPDSSGDLRTHSPSSARTSWSLATQANWASPPSFVAVHSRYSFTASGNPVSVSRLAFHYVLQRMADLSVWWSYFWPGLLMELLENYIQEVPVQSATEGKCRYRGIKCMTDFSDQIPVIISKHLNTSICIFQSSVESGYVGNLQKSRATSHLAGNSSVFLIHFGSLTKIPAPAANTLKSFILFLGLSPPVNLDKARIFWMTHTWEQQKLSLHCRRKAKSTP